MNNSNSSNSSNSANKEEEPLLYVNLQGYPFYLFEKNSSSVVRSDFSSTHLNYSKFGPVQLSLCMPTFTPSENGPWALFHLLRHRLQFVVNVSQVPRDYLFSFYSCGLHATELYRDAFSGVGEINFMDANRDFFHMTLQKPFDLDGFRIGTGSGAYKSCTHLFYDLSGRVTDTSLLYGYHEDCLINTHFPFLVYIDFIANSLSPPHLLNTITIRLCQHENTIEQKITKGRSSQEDDYLSILSSFIIQPTMTMTLLLWKQPESLEIEEKKENIESTIYQITLLPLLPLPV
jgi:hypothetical protein